MRIYPLTEAKRARWEKEGRGTGEDADYLSWLRYEDVASKGDKHRLLEGDYGRLCALFSNVERRLFLYLDASFAVKGLYDQVKLDLAKTRQIAADLGIQHPRDPQSGVDITMTTDLRAKVLTDTGPVWMPFSCKYFADVGDFNSAEHMQIERVYWQQEGETLRVVTDNSHCIPDVVNQNLEQLHPHRLLHRELLAGGLTLEERTAITLRAVLAASKSQPLNEFAIQMAVHYGLSTADWMAQIYYLVYLRLLRADLFSGDLRQQDVLGIARATQQMLDTAKVSR